MDIKIEVDMEDYKVEADCDVLYTIGLGPCIGVAFSYQGTGFMFHIINAWHSSESMTDPFFRCAEKMIPHGERQKIHPVVAGAAFENQDPENDEATNKETLLSRDYVIDKLSGLGFGAPNIYWAAPNSARDLSLVIKEDTVAIRTAHYTVAGTEYENNVHNIHIKNA